MDTTKSLLQESDIVGVELLDGEKLEENKVVLKSMMSEYQTLWGKILERHLRLKKQFGASYPPRQLVDESIQVETLRMEADSSVQVNTLPSSILRHQNYVKELRSALLEFERNIDKLEEIVSQSSAADVPNLTSEVRMEASNAVASCESSAELVKHLNCLASKNDSSLSPQVTFLMNKFNCLKGSPHIIKLHNFSDVQKYNCPFCSGDSWQHLNSEIWRMEKWLQKAEHVQEPLQRIPSSLEDLEDTIVENKKFFMYLESHKNLLRGLNAIGSHLGTHMESDLKTQDFKEKLATINVRWNRIQDTAAAWKTELQSALVENEELYESLQDWGQWMEKLENSVHTIVPVDLTQGASVLIAQYNHLKDIHHDLDRLEPRIVSVHRVVQELLKESEDHVLYTQLSELCSRLKSLYTALRTNILKLGSTLGKDPCEIRSVFSSSSHSLLSLSNELLDDTTGEALSSSGGIDQTDPNALNLSQSPWFLRRRVWCATLPVQAVMLLMLAAAVLIPGVEDDYLCVFSGSMARSFNLHLQYPDGAPPI